MQSPSSFSPLSMTWKKVSVSYYFRKRKWWFLVHMSASWLCFTWKIPRKSMRYLRWKICLRDLTLAFLRGAFWKATQSSRSLRCLCKLCMMIPPYALCTTSLRAGKSKCFSEGGCRFYFPSLTTVSLSKYFWVILIQPHLRSSAAFPRHRSRYLTMHYLC